MRILRELRGAPQNAHRLAQALSLDYRTTRHHLQLLERGGLIFRPIGDAYGSPYMLAPHIEAEFGQVEALTGAPGSSVRPRGLLARSAAVRPAP